MCYDGEIPAQKLHVSILLVVDIGLEELKPSFKKSVLTSFNPSCAGYRSGSIPPDFRTIKTINVSILLVLDIGLEENSALFLTNLN